MDLVIYEDYRYRNFLPLAYFRPVFDLKCGIFTFRERVKKLYPGVALHLLIRDYLLDLEKERGSSSLNDPGSLKDRALFLNGRGIFGGEELPLEGAEEVFLCGDEVVGFRLKERLKDLKLEAPVQPDFLNSLREELPARKVGVKVLGHPWELVDENSDTIAQDSALLSGGGGEGEVDERAVVYGDRGRLRVGKGSRVEAYTVLNLEKGPICVGEGVLIRSHSTIDGPCHIGDGTLVEGAQLRPGCSVGEVCKISGELEASIFQGYSNKHHLGFLGHSYVAEWVNLGAGTTNSDLKNNYSPVRVELNGEGVDTGRVLVGCFIGDHSKTGIGTLISTGAVIGVFSNLFGGKGVTPKFIPSFSWGDGQSFTEYLLDRAVETARAVMGRRGVELTDTYEKLIREVYALSSSEREGRWKTQQ